MSTSHNINATISPLLNNRLSQLVILLTLAWAAIDAVDRVQADASSDIKAATVTNIAQFNMPQLAGNTVTQLTSVYSQYQDDVAAEPSKNIGMSAQDQANQQGELSSLFIGDNKLVLKAVISSSPKGRGARSRVDKNEAQLKALILITNVNTGQTQIESFTDQSLVHGYTLTVEKNTKVSLTKQQATGLQKIILTMYQGNKGPGS